MRHFALTLAAIVVVLLAAWPVAAASLTLAGGTAWNLPMPLTIVQKGEQDIRIARAEWETRPLYEAPYYAIRMAGQTWGLSVIHHKLYLLTSHPDVQSFWVSHGYNLILGERYWRAGRWMYSAGLGPVLTHPETTVRGKTLADPPHAEISFEGYYLSGIAGSWAIAYVLPLTSWFQLVAETKSTAAWARVPIADGYADVPNVALHVNIGAQFSW
ncbi:hypothetical protein U7230_12330 [Carboxydochorda subterranea]|uniref:Outer membrane protein beta-barrel domain-containing protein n=1 Tax=Carboxydichorda subterranea TaxID=3109565 RepID=A0ABZ1BVR1_9FIRM|nr:hypothetical protein [Limnochorda sp. L945t]WRP16862.1 hypothetical protein U7230_12330 [Limnochorda sp. L945t]